MNHHPIAPPQARLLIAHCFLLQCGAEILALRGVDFKIPVRAYLADILPGLANASIQRIADITPAAWVAKHP